MNSNEFEIYKTSWKISIFKFCSKIENTKRNAMACDLCKVNKLKLAQANGNCRRLEQINQNLKEQIKYLMEKIRMQEKTNEKNVVEVPNENPSQQIETTTIQSPNQSSNEDASNSIQDGIYLFTYFCIVLLMTFIFIQRLSFLKTLL